MTKDDTDGTATPDNASDIAFVKALAEVLQENDLGELEVERAQKGGPKLSVRISKTGPAPVAQVYAAPIPAAASASAVLTPAAMAAEPTAANDDPAKLPGVVTSPMVGTVYLSAEPGTEPFVKVGDSVSEGQTLLIVEAMKTMNHIPSPRAGTVRRILVEDSSAVEYGAPLLVVE